MVVAAALLAFVSGSASAAPSDIRLGQVVVEARFLEISVINTGTTSLDSLVASFPTGTVVTSVSSVGATFCAVSNEKNGALCLYGNGWAPNTTKTLDLELTAPLAKGANVVVCSGDSCVDVKVAKPEPCECAEFGAHTVLKTLGGNKRPVTLKIQARWILECTETEGEEGCIGQVELLEPKRTTDIDQVSPKKQPVVCRNDCGSGKTGATIFAFRSNRDLLSEERAGERFSFPLRTACIVDGKRSEVRTRPMTIVFKRNGAVDRQKSDLDASGRPDSQDED